MLIRTEIIESQKFKFDCETITRQYPRFKDAMKDLLYYLRCNPLLGHKEDGVRILPLSECSILGFKPYVIYYTTDEMTSVVLLKIEESPDYSRPKDISVIEQLGLRDSLIDSE